jgi:hypothetical protein
LEDVVFDTAISWLENLSEELAVMDGIKKVNLNEFETL